MKDFATIPFHDEIAEKLLNINQQQAGFFEARVTTNNKGLVQFSPNDIYARVLGELASIRASKYSTDEWRRVFMFFSHRCPTWPEMVELKELFFHPGEIVIQYHPKASEYVNENKHALHLWEPKDPEQIKTLQEAAIIAQRAAKTLRRLFTHKDKSRPWFFDGSISGKNFVAYFCGDTWPTWEEMCEVKQEHFGPEVTAFQLNISKEFDLHPSKILTLWNAAEFGIKLPPKSIV